MHGFRQAIRRRPALRRSHKLTGPRQVMARPRWLVRRPLDRQLLDRADSFCGMYRAEVRQWFRAVDRDGAAEFGDR